MKYRLILYAFIITFLFNYILGLCQSIELNQMQMRVDARSSENFVMESKILNHEIDSRNCVPMSSF